ncbi:Putative ribosomal N-acetyltransferase YdaF [Marinomonas aquimarina]|uniref:Putative ribosomal N-acetyltransferase YdaF n=1 Tax=Marinomonas aquimarina TaxID=295068 RepID=A0A1A8T3U9_9GAMM|nr:GNAT family N-acetyltransferase [Marinomonas aquimarina]SBS26112.1 Putative ribosomal N-acetyltransferase YdaF [Marinomonas aquimarina]
MEHEFATPYYAVCIDTSTLLDDVMYRVMTEKVIELAAEQEGFLYHEWVAEEASRLAFYWREKSQAEAWMTHSMMTRTLSIGSQFWFERFSLKLMEVHKEKVVVNHQSWRDSARFPVIKTPRGVLKLLELEDVSLLKTYVNEQREHLAVWEPLRSEDFYSEETCRLRIKEMRRDFLEDRGCVLCLLDPKQERMLAYSNYSQFARGVSQSCFLGYSLAQDLQGQGYMQECLQAGIEYVSKELNIDRIQACYMSRNHKSAAVLARLNFEKEGVARNYLKINGQWEDHILTALTLR